MRSLDFSRNALMVYVTAAMLAGCGGSQPPIGAPGAVAQNTTRENAKLTYHVLHSFGAAPDGNDPGAGVIGLGDDGTFYGTTIFGGAYSCSPTYKCGTVFSITTGGTETVLHSFTNENDGANPEADLIAVGGTFYGTTYSGGYGFGMVFSITPEGVEKVLHSFGNGTDGRNPHAGLIDVRGRLYGTTEFGGVENRGTVFSITMDGSEKVLHSFGKGTDGSQPLAQLIYLGGTFYGTTSEGGRYACGRFSCGTVFSMTTDGTERVLRSLSKGTGSHPGAGLIDVGGTFYGTTSDGGRYNCGRSTCGTVFSITTGGKEKVLHSFGRGSDGVDPAASLVDIDGTLYGTTYLGGAYAGGATFSIASDGTERVLHSFGSGKDGKYPLAGMIYKHGSLVGTTSIGGAYGYGTVFSLTP